MSRMQLGLLLDYFINMKLIYLVILVLFIKVSPVPYQPIQHALLMRWLFGRFILSHRTTGHGAAFCAYGERDTAGRLGCQTDRRAVKSAPGLLRCRPSQEQRLLYLIERQNLS